MFVHGLGGCVASFSPLLTSLINVAPCLAIDLPGCGRSKFKPRAWNAYTTEALAELLAVVIREHARTVDGQGVVFVGHSMGCSLSALLCTHHFPPGNDHGLETLGLIAICPQSQPFTGKKYALVSLLLQIPTFALDLYRAVDRRNGTESASIYQFAGKDADLELRQIQMRFNRQSRSPVFRRMAWGSLPRHLGSWTLNTGLPDLSVWGNLKIPLFLFAGESDTVTKVDQVEKIASALGRPPVHRDSRIGEDAEGQGGPSLDELGTLSQSKTTLLDHAAEQPTEDTPQFSKRRRVLKTVIIPAPAAHALMYDPTTYRTLAGLIQSFISAHVDTRLSLGWQLQHLSTEGKWDVKNLAKWQAVQPVSKPIAGIFRAMKTLREIDDTHSPEQFVERWTGKIRAVIDISHESPVYDHRGLDERGIEYHKLPSVSKIPPTAEEVRDFINLVNRLRDSFGILAPLKPDPSSNSKPRSASHGPFAEFAPNDDEDSPVIGVHCHYGFNRTGFFIASYLVEHEGYSVQAAIDTFAAARPKGIKHAHFLDQLFVRYCVGLKRAPTV